MVAMILGVLYYILLCTFQRRAQHLKENREFIKKIVLSLDVPSPSSARASALIVFKIEKDKKVY